MNIAKRDPAGQLDLNHTIVIEHCNNCKTHNTHTRHDEAKYAQYAAMLAQRIKEKSGQNCQILCNEVPKAWAMQDTYC